MVALLLFGSGLAVLGGLPLRGNLGSHDPGTIIRCKDRYYLFSTGRGINSKWSTNKLFWSTGPRVFTNAPAWASGTVTNFDGNIWAPDILLVNGRYCLYYAISSWGSQMSAIGLVSNPTLDPAAPAYRWTDQGIVIQSTNGSPYNTIDPSVMLDASGNPWMAFGSYWNGIYLVQLNPTNGLRMATNSPVTRLAWNSSIEAACLRYRAGYYYLFVNWGSCCSGVNSTYNVRVGRSVGITGPYLDRNGVDMRSPGGTPFLEGTGKFVGPGHVGIFSEEGQDWFSYHYYDAGAYAPWYGAFGAATFDIAPLSWTADGWPVYTNDWSAVYRFENDARDDGGQYYGLLQGGAAITTDPARGPALNLAGSNQCVRLPAGVAFARTFAAVVKWNGGDDWQRIFDFGTDTSRYLMLTPSSGTKRLTFHIKAGGAVQSLEAPTALPIGVWTHVAVTLDGARGVLYRDGLPVATNTAVTLSPLEVRAQTNHLGRSKFTADPDFSGQFASFRVWGRALSANEIAAPQPRIVAPGESAATWPGQQISFSGGATDFLERPLPATGLSWRLEFVRPTATNLIAGPLTGVTNGTFTLSTNFAASTNGFYRIRLTATDASTRTAVRLVNLAPTTTNAQPDWNSYYPFNSGAQDASNVFSGTLIGGASIQNDVERGAAARLSGASQYVSLPAGASTLRTLSGWVKWNGGADWQRVFDFGSSTERWFMLTPRDGEGRLQVGISSERSEFVQVIQAEAALPTNTWTHVAVTMDGRQGVLYLNGEAVAINHSVNLLPADVAATRCWLGRSQYSADAYLGGWLDSWRLNSRALTAGELFAPNPSFVLPTVGRLFSGAEQITFAGSATDYRETALAPSAFQWRVEFRQDGTSTLRLTTNGVTGGSFVAATNGPLSTNVSYRVTLTTADQAGRVAAVSREVAPRVATFALDTLPTGLALGIEGQTLSTPASFPVVVGWPRRVEAQATQSAGGTNLDFVLWSDGGAATHNVTPPASGSALLASYTHPALALSLAGTNVALNWPAWAAPMQVQAATNLAPPIAWQTLTQAPVNADQRLVLNLPLQTANQFYRLAKP